MPFNKPDSIGWLDSLRKKLDLICFKIWLPYCQKFHAANSVISSVAWCPDETSIHAFEAL